MWCKVLALLQGPKFQTSIYCIINSEPEYYPSGNFQCPYMYYVWASWSFLVDVYRENACWSYLQVVRNMIHNEENWRKLLQFFVNLPDIITTIMSIKNNITLFFTFHYFYDSHSSVETVWWPLMTADDQSQFFYNEVTQNNSVEEHLVFNWEFFYSSYL